MAVTDQQKLDFLLKKIGYTKTKTGSVVGTGAISGTPKQPFAEAIPSPLVVANSSLWNEADSIPATPPGADTTQVKVYLAATSGLRMTADATSSGQRAYIAYSTYNNTSSARLTNWIDTQFGASYIIKVYKGDPNSGGVNLSAAGSGQNDGWFFDYSAGVLNFNDTNVPSGVTDTNIYIVGYRYIGQTGAPTSGISTFSYLDLTVERNLDVGIQGGISTFRNNIDLNADLDVDGHTNLDNVNIAGVTTFAGEIDANGRIVGAQLGNVIPFYYNNFSDFPSSATYHGAVAHAHNTGRLYFAHAGWKELVNKEANGRVGTGTENYFINSLVSTSTTATSLNVVGISTFSSNVDINANIDVSGNSVLHGDLDVDGHTNLDNISVAGVSTFTGDATFSGNVSIGGTLTYEDVTNVDSVGLLTARSGIRVTGGVIEALAGENKIPSLYANMAALPSASTYHGMFAHVHATQKGYFAHGGAWYELVNKELNGRVGTGTESYFIDRLVSTSTTATSLNVTGVTTAVTVDINGDLDVDGHTNLDNVSVAGVTTFAGDLYIAENIIHTGDTDTKISFPSNDTIKLETGSNYITHDDSKTVFKNNIRCGDFVAHRNTDSLGIKLLNGGTGNNNTRVGLGAEDNGTSTNHKTFNVYRQGSAVERVNIDNFGTLNAKQAFTVAGISTLSGNVDINADLDVDGHTNLDNVSIAGVTTFAGNIDANGDLDVDGHTELDNVSVSGILTVTADHPRIRLVDTNANDDFQISNFNGTFFITDQTDNHNRFSINSAGRVDVFGALYGGGRLDIAGNAFIHTDLDVDGHTELDNVNIVGVTTAAGHVLPSADVTYDLGSSSKQWRNLYADNIVSAPGNGFIGPDLTVRNLKATGLSTFVGQSEFDGNAKFDSTITAGGGTGTNGQYLKTTGSGVAWATFPALRTRDTQTASAGQTSFPFNYNVGFVDVFVNGVKLTDSEFTATNGTSIVLAVGSFVGDIVELVSYNTVSAGGGASGIGNVVEDTTPQLGGNLDLFSKTINGTGGINITGVVTATTFIGDGSGLTGIVASGAGGVVIKDSGSTVGTAGTIDFGDNLSVSPINAGIVTITSGVTTSQFNVNNLDVSGITTISGITTFSDTVHFAYNPGTSADKFWFWGNGTDRYAVFRRENISSPAFNLSNLTRLTLGSSQQSEIVSENSQATFIKQYTTSSNNPLKIQSDFSNFVGSPTSSHSSRKIADFEFLEGCSLYYTGTKRLQTSGIGITVTGGIVASGDLDVDGHTNLDNVSIAGVVTATTFKGALEATSGSFSSNIDANGDLDVDGHTNLDNLSVAGVSTFSGNLHVGIGATVGIGSTAYVHKIAFKEAGSVNSTLSAALGVDGSSLTFVGGGVQNGFWGNAGLRIGGNGSSALTGPESGCSLHVVSTDNTKVLFHGAANAQIELRSTTGNGVENIFRSNKALDFVTGTGAYSNVFRVGETEGSTFFHTLNFRASDGGTATTTIDAISGIVTATKFVGDGSGLTGITASGSGVVIKHDGSTVGTAGTINFSTNLDVSAVSAGIVTITASGGGSGISTISGVVNIVNDLDVDGHTNLDNASIAGVATVTALHLPNGNSSSSGMLRVGASGSSNISIFHNGGHGNIDNNQGELRFYSDTNILLSPDDDVNVGTAITFSTVGNATYTGIVTASSFVGDGSGLTGISGGGTNVGITTNLSGTFTASAGSPSTINTFAYHDNDKVVEYTIYIKNGSNFQSQKLLAMRDGTTIHSTQFAVMFSSSLLVQCDATISSGNILLRATPETGISGSTTYKVKREVM